MAQTKKSQATAPKVQSAPAVGEPVKKDPEKVAATKDPYDIGSLDPRFVQTMFQSLNEYKGLKITNLDVLIKSMLYVMNIQIGAAKGPVPITPFTVFVESLLKIAIEKGTKGVARG